MDNTRHKARRTETTTLAISQVFANRIEGLIQTFTRIALLRQFEPRRVPEQGLHTEVGEVFELAAG